MNVLWFIIAILLLIVESQILNLVAIWFCCSSFITYILSFCINNFYIEFLLFLLGGIVIGLCLREKFLKIINKRERR